MKRRTLIPLFLFPLFVFLTMSICIGSSAWAGQLPVAPGSPAIINDLVYHKVPMLPAVAQTNADFTLPWRGVLLGADYGSATEPVHHDNAYVQINNGPVLYYASMPARREGSQLTDSTLLWHLFSRDNTTYTLYLTSSYVNGFASELSEGLSIYFDFDSFGCTEQTVPVADAGSDQIAQIGSVVTLDASGSFDPYAPDNSSLVYVWECYSAPESVVDLSNGGLTAITAFTPGVAGNYYFRLTIRDRVGGNNYNRSSVSYVRISAVTDPDDPDLLNANAGSPQQIQVGSLVTLDGSLSRGPEQTSYAWEQTNPLGTADINNLAEVFGTSGCSGQCYKANFDADSDIDGSDLALLAANLGPVPIINSDQPVAQFEARIPRPHIFRLTLTEGIRTASETTIVAVNHPNVAEVVSPAEVDLVCLTP